MDIKKENVLLSHDLATGIFCFKKEMVWKLGPDTKETSIKFTKEISTHDIIPYNWNDQGTDVKIIENTVIRKEYYEHAQTLANILSLDLKIFVSEIPFYPVCFCFGNNRKFGFVVAPMDSVELRAEIAKITENKPI